MIKKITIIAILACASITFVCLLAFFESRLSHSKNHFVRSYPSHLLQGSGFVDLDKPGYYYTGRGKDGSFLFSSRIRFNDFAVVNFNDRLIKASSCRFSGSFDVYPNVYFSADCQRLYLFDGLSGMVRYGDKEGMILTDSISTPTYSLAVPLSACSFIFKRINQARELEVVKFQSGKVRTPPPILQAQGEGLFSTDGMLLKVPGANKLIYTYYYRNEFICMDTSLKILYRGNTIDTNTTAKINVQYIASKKEYTLSSIPKIVNKQTAVSKTRLFVLGGLKADNETDQLFEQSADIDVYQLSNGRYEFTLSIPRKFSGKRLNDFFVDGQQLLAVYQHYVCLFDILK